MTSPRSMLQAIQQNPNNAQARLEALREIVATRLDETDSARETGTLARCLLDIETAMRTLIGATAVVDPVDELRQRRTARGAK